MELKKFQGPYAGKVNVINVWNETPNIPMEKLPKKVVHML